MAENRPSEGSTSPTGTYQIYEDEEDGDRSRRGRNALRSQSRYWRCVPSVSVLPGEKRQLPANFLLRSGLVAAIELLVVLTAARYLDLNDFENRAETTQTLSQLVERQLSARRSEIEPLQTQINLLSLELESAETTYELATAGQADWFTAMSGLFGISVIGVDFLSAIVNSDGGIALVGVATSPDAIASLPTQLSQLAGTINLQGIQWDAAVSPPYFTADFQVNR